MRDETHDGTDVVARVVTDVVTDGTHWVRAGCPIQITECDESGECFDRSSQVE